MKKILIISDGLIGSHFIQRVAETYSSDNLYYIVELKSNNYTDVNPSRFKFYQFDPTSFYKLANLLKMEFIQVVIAMDNLSDIENTIKNIRMLKKKLRVVVLNQSNIKNEDPNVVLINANEILSSRLLDYLPNVPVIAQNVGLGEGEIMEVMVPSGSSYIYKHIGIIEQKNWRIVAVYRDKKLVIPTRRTMIQPNDFLVLVGEPSVLKSVYRSIQKELGQFPEPYGSSIYLYIDMNLLDHSTAEKFVQRAIFVHKKFNVRLIIKIVNPGDIYVLQQIKAFRDDNITIDIEYDNVDLKNKFFNDLISYHVGLIIVSKTTFSNNAMRTTLHESHLPVLKIADKSFSNIKEASVILADNRDLEKIASNIFDISEQMGYNIELYNYLSEHQENKEQVIDHFYSLSTIFSKTIKVIKENKNPIKTLQKKDKFIQILPFTIKLTSLRIFSNFSIDSELLNHNLDEYHQIFIPVQL